MNDQHDLELLIKSRFPIVIVESYEEPKLTALIEKIANLEDWAFYTWSVTEGLNRRNVRSDPAFDTCELSSALRHVSKSLQNGVYLLRDAHPFISDPLVVRLIKDIAQGYTSVARTLVFFSPQIDLPEELSRFSARFKLALPGKDDMRLLITVETQLWERESGNKVRVDPRALDLLVQHLAGMAEVDARRLVRMAIRDDSAINLDDIGRVLKAKTELLGNNSVLSIQIDTSQFAEIAGMKNLKRWLQQRRDAFIGSADTAGLDVPKGVLLLGVQGGGKSLAAKTVAGAWGLPLLQLDFGALYNKYFGETEKNMRDALAQAEAMAPCVLWADEIEKGIGGDSGGSSDGGVSRRVLGTLLTWMAERKSRVFLVATANDISRLPPELIRKGRFDEIFFVDLPNAESRAEIFRIHLKRRGIDPGKFPLEGLAKVTERFTGAEIEQAIVSALYEAHAQKAPLNAIHILEELRRTKPLAIVMAEQVEALRDWAAGRTVPAE
jgi:SpoVK/Ycf46/Vps4 family AAA+-type ATPase